MKSIIIVHTAENELIQDTLESIRRFTQPPYEIILFSSSPVPVTNDNNLKIIKGGSTFDFSQALSQVAEKVNSDLLFFLKSGVIVTENCFKNLLKNLDSDTNIVAPIFNSKYFPQNYKKYVEIPEELILKYGPGVFFKDFENKYFIEKSLDPVCFLIRGDFLRRVAEKFSTNNSNILFFNLLEFLNNEGKQIKVCLDSVAIDVQPGIPEINFYGDFDKYLEISRRKYADFVHEEFVENNIFHKDKKKTFSIVILTYNKLDFTKICIDSLLKYTDMTNGEVIVIDNNSTDATVDYLSGIKEIKLIKNKENRGFPAAVNQGILESSGDYIFIVNNDIVVTEGWMDAIMAKFDENPRIAAVGPRTNYIAGYQMDMSAVYANEKEMFIYARKRSREYKGQYTFVRFLKGFCFAVKKDVIDRIGGLDERFGIGNFEDDDFSHRILKSGYLLTVAEDVFVHMDRNVFASTSAHFLRFYLDRIIRRELAGRPATGAAQNISMACEDIANQLVDSFKEKHPTASYRNLFAKIAETPEWFQDAINEIR